MNEPEQASLSALRKDALGIFHAGVSAADPYRAVKNCLVTDNGHLEIRLNTTGNALPRTGRWPKVHLIAFGKGACLMAKAALEIIPESLLAGPGLAVTNYENVVPLAGLEVIGAAHPLPDESGLKAAKRIAERVKAAQAGELVLFLISGGGSALIPYPVEGISLPEKCKTTALLLASGAGIQEINCVRKHLSRLKGGGLAQMAYPADVHALVLSDVLGDDLSSIASGPTVADSSTFAEAIAVFQKRHLWRQVPSAVRDYLERGLKKHAPETPKPGDKLFEHSACTLIGSNRISLNRAVQTAQERGYEAIIYSDHFCGIAREAAKELAIAANNHIKKMTASKAPVHKPLALLAGGETTVLVKGNGRGGRNQEMALAFALAAEQIQLPGRWAFLSGGTDGRDGPTDSAGGLVDPLTLKRMIAAGVDPVGYLDNNDSHAALEASEDLLDTGATGTNVADLQVLLIHFPL
jgi:glycerate 2-kinase